MAQQIFAYILHKEGAADDTAMELISAARKLSPDAQVTALVFGSGAELESACKAAAATYKEVWKIDHESLSYPNAEIIRGMMTRIVPKEAVVLVPHEHFGMDLSPGLSILLNSPYLPDVIGFDGWQDNQIKGVRQEFTGMVSTHVACDASAGAVVTVRPGAFAPDESKSENGQVTDKTAEAIDGGIPGQNRRYLEVVQAEAGDVDITKAEILVSVGRGIEDQDNLEMIFDLAKAVGGEVSCSRPIVDAKWLEKPRQVGTSGQTVKPKVYMALGISGSFQHLGGIKGAPFMVAVNKNPKAPIFQVADVGVVADILEFVPELTDKVNEGK